MADLQCPASDPPSISGGKGNGFFVYFRHVNGRANIFKYACMTNAGRELSDIILLRINPAGLALMLHLK